MTRPLPPILALLLAVVACGHARSPVSEKWDASIHAVLEGRKLRAKGDGASARETFLRAYHEGLDVLRAVETRKKDGGDLPGRAEVLNHLANVCVELGLRSPSYLVSSFRYAMRALHVSPNYSTPWLNLGVAYDRAGLYADAAAAFRRFVAHADPEGARLGRQKLYTAVYNEGAQILVTRHIGCEARARALWSPMSGKSPRLRKALSRLNLEYAQEANAAAKNSDVLELIRVHARYGFPDAARKTFIEARNRGTIRRSEDLRWVQARYVDEIDGSPRALKQATRLYEEMMGRGENTVQASAGWARVMLREGKPQAVLKRLAGFPEMSTELRRQLIRARLAVIRGLSPKAEKDADEQFGKIFDLFDGGLDPNDRSDLLEETGRTAVQRKSVRWTTRTIRAVTSRFPRDLRVTLLEADLADMKGDPLPGTTVGSKTAKVDSGDR